MKVLLSILFLCIHLTGIAQYVEVSLNTKVELSDLIVEAEIIDQETTKLGHKIFTVSKIKVNKSLKGKLPDEIEVFTLGGHFEDFFQSHTHLLSLDTGQMGMLFLKKTAKLGQNAYRVVSSEQGFYEYKRDLNGFLKVKSLFDSQYLSTPDQLYENIIKLSKQKLTFISENQLTEDSNCLNISLKQVPVVDHISGVIRFSIQLDFDREPKYLNNINLNFSYEQDILGSSIISSGKLNIFKGAMLNKDGYNLQAIDSSPGEVVVNLSKLGFDNFTLIDLFKKEILIVEYTYTNINEIFALHLNEIESDLTSEFLNREDFEISTIDCTRFEVAEFNSCELEITRFEVSEGAAGVNGESLNDPSIPGVLTIYGKNFGESLGSFVKPYESDVLFYFVDNNSYIQAPELEYISWSDTKIEVNIPTVDKFVSLGKYFQGYASTGFFKVRTTKYDTNSDGSCVEEVCEYSSENLSNGKLVVKFAATNGPWTNDFDNRQTSCNVFETLPSRGGNRINLVNHDGFGGYSLFVGDFHSDQIINQKVKYQFTDALDTWRCGFKINVGETIYFDENETSRIRAVNMDTELGVFATTMIEVQESGVGCSVLQDQDYALERFEIELNDLYFTATQEINGDFTIYHYEDSDPVPYPSFNFYDLQSIFLHELGHAFGLLHTNNEGDLMEPRLSANEVHREITGNDALGAEHIYELSQKGACNKDHMLDYECNITSTSIPKNIKLLEIFPNPSSGNLRIQSSNLITKIEIIDLNGRKVQQIEILDSSSEEVNLNLPVGIYFIKAYDINLNFVESSKLIINK